MILTHFRYSIISKISGQARLTSIEFGHLAFQLPDFIKTVHTMKNVLKIGLRQNAIFIPDEHLVSDNPNTKQAAFVLATNLSKLGYAVSESLIQRLQVTSIAYQAEILKYFREVMGVNKNWTPLVKGWNEPTGENYYDHLLTWISNIFQGAGTKLACGHIIPPNTFPLERYNGCPFCGTPFQFDKLIHYGQGSNKKLLSLWTMKEANQFFINLLSSKTALDATQADSLKMLLGVFPLPTTVEVGMKETSILLIDYFVENKEPQRAQSLFKSPTDILRYLWYKHTGFLQIVEPKTIIKRSAANQVHFASYLDKRKEGKATSKNSLKLKYNRTQCRMVADWLNNLPISAEQACEIMHPKRGIWVRFIRALRLAEYAKRDGFERLATLMDVFYRQDYETWQGRVDAYRLASDEEKTLLWLQKRPGLFARSLFSNMLWFGSEQVIDAFAKVINQVPARLVFTLQMYANYYFEKGQHRTVKPLGGVNKVIPTHSLLALYDFNQLESMKMQIANLALIAMEKRFAAINNANKTIYIEPNLYKMPVAIGDRSDTIQDMPTALMGTRFPIEGDTVRIFMQWGVGLPAQHLDMDLSCHIAFEDGNMQICSYANLVATGCKHSGDIRSIPNKIGTAEYIEINIKELAKNKAKYVTFTCNAYSNGAISPNLVVGWMNSKYPMRISEASGVAYDPSCVQHQVRVTQSLSKGLVFGILDVATREVVWLEMSFQGQVIQQLNTKGVRALLNKLDSKLSIGNLLKIKAEAQGLIMLDSAAADENYTMDWARDAAAVTKLLID